MSTLTWVGKSVRRIDGNAKVRGTQIFPSDIKAPNMLHCKPVFAPHPHARIIEIHVEDALSVPGVLQVLTHKDIPGKNRYSFSGDHPGLCDDKTRYIGDMVAVVIAEDDKAAAEGARMVKIDFTPLPLVTDPHLVLANKHSGSPVHEQRGHLLHQVHVKQGDVETVFGQNDLIILEQIYHNEMWDHAFIETEAGFAYPEDDGVCVVSQGQAPFYDRSQIALLLGLDIEKVRTIEALTGGAFGGKADLTVHFAIALAALLTQRPCKMVWSREEHAVAGVKPHPFTIKLKTAAHRDGRLAALQAEIVADTGAYGLLGEAMLETSVENICGLYRWPATKIDAWSVYTNNAATGAFRGFGANQACQALESQMTQMANLVGMDSIKFRLLNALHQGEVSGNGHTLLLPIGTSDALEAAYFHPIWRDRELLHHNSGPIRRGTGMAMGVKGYSYGINDAQDYGVCALDLSPNGHVRLYLGTIDTGQGTLTTMAQIAAEVLQCNPAFIELASPGDTRYTQDTGMAAASRITYTLGRAVKAGAEELCVKICQVAAEEMKVGIEDLYIRDGAVCDKRNNNSIPFSVIAEAASMPLRVDTRLRVHLSEVPFSGGLGHPHVLYSSNVQVAQVAVDVETGEVCVERVASFPDIGRAINPLSVEGQCEGGISQGVGITLLEKVHLENGCVLNPEFGQYPIPTSCDVPLVETILIEKPEESGPFGAKGIGENAVVPTAPAILNAIEDAIGIRFLNTPVLPEDVVRELKNIQ